MRSIFFAAIICLPACCSAIPFDANTGQQAAKRPSPPGTLHSVVVKGNQLYSSADIVKESGLKDGEGVDRAVIDKARQKLKSTELFNSVAYQ